MACLSERLSRIPDIALFGQRIVFAESCQAGQCLMLSGVHLDSLNFTFAAVWYNVRTLGQKCVRARSLSYVLSRHFVTKTFGNHALQYAVSVRCVWRWPRRANAMQGQISVVTPNLQYKRSCSAKHSRNSDNSRIAKLKKLLLSVFAFEVIRREFSCALTRLA